MSFLRGRLLPGVFPAFFMDFSPEILCWNPRGLNDQAKRDAVREFIGTVRVNLVCLQETKLAVIDSFTVMQCLGPSFDGFAYLPAQETRGGILLAWDSSQLQVDQVFLDDFVLTARVSSLNSEPWWISVVYGPQCREEKVEFLRQIVERRTLTPGAWLAIGDFNMIMRASEKNNNNLDRGMMTRFRNMVHQLELKELYMHGRLYTWSNGRQVPTMTRIDRALASVDWDLQFPDALLQTLSSSVSDHAPLHLSLSACTRPKHRFKFELFWANLEGFQEAVAEAWVCDPAITDPFKRLDALLRNTAKHLQAWGQRSVGNIKLQIAMANAIIYRFDVAQEHRELTLNEDWLRRTLKLVVLGLASLERTIARQRSRIRWLKEGDANTKLFHAVANGRRCKNFIAAVNWEGETLTDQGAKEEAFFRAYHGLLGETKSRGYSLDLEVLGLPTLDLQDLDALISEQEVWSVIKELPADRAPGPDGFIGIFYQKAWGIIRQDVMAVILKLAVGDGRGFDKLNRAYITLIPKKPDAQEVGDYRPISLVHSISKLFSKILANRLRPKMVELVSANQSAFIKERALHDNFVLVRSLARRINARKEKSGVPQA